MEITYKTDIPGNRNKKKLPYEKDHLRLSRNMDGFIEGPNGEIDWCIMEGDVKFTDFLAEIDTILYGRVSYDMWGNYQPKESEGP